MLSLEENKTFEYQIVKKTQDKIMVVYLEGIILSRLRTKELSGYDLIKALHKDFKLLVSAGTMYSTIYSLERQGFIECRLSGRKKVYRLTDTGKYALKIVAESKDLKNLLFTISKEFFSEQHINLRIKLAMEAIKRPLKPS